MKDSPTSNITKNGTRKSVLSAGALIVNRVDVGKDPENIIYPHSSKPLPEFHGKYCWGDRAEQCHAASNQLKVRRLLGAGVL